MIAASRTPFGRSPLRNAFSMSALLQLPMPVSLSWVMLEAVTLNGGSSQVSPDDRSRSSTGAPRSPFGVWQFWQVMMVVTRYLPRSTGAWFCANAEPAAASKAAATRIPRAIIEIPRAKPCRVSPVTLRLYILIVLILLQTVQQRNRAVGWA